MVKKLKESELNPRYSYWTVTIIYSLEDGSPDEILGTDIKEVFDTDLPYDKRYYKGKYYFEEKSFETEEEARKFKNLADRSEPIRFSNYKLTDTFGESKRSKKKRGIKEASYTGRFKYTSVADVAIDIKNRIKAAYDLLDSGTEGLTEEDNKYIQRSIDLLTSAYNDCLDLCAELENYS